MFIKTIAVGPLEPVAFCVTGGATVALPRLHRGAHVTKSEVAGEFVVARLATCVIGVRIAIGTDEENETEPQKAERRINVRENGVQTWEEVACCIWAVNDAGQ